MKSTPSIVVFEPDLLFSSRIEGQARRIGVDLKLVTDYDGLLWLLRENFPELLIVNLDLLETRFAQLQYILGGKSCKSVGYFSHMNVRLGEEAKQCGIELVMSRGAFIIKMKKFSFKLRAGKQYAVMLQVLGLFACSLQRLSFHRSEFPL